MATTNTNHENNGPDKGPLPVSLFFIYDDQAQRIVDTALQYRVKASESARDALSAAIDNSGISIDGFRKASMAPTDQLAGPIHSACSFGNNKLAAAVVRVWTECRSDLADAVMAHLSDLGETFEYPPPKREFFEQTLGWSAFARKRDAIAERGAFDSRDIELMLICLTGNRPLDDYDIKSPLLDEWLKELRALPLDAPDWDEVSVFTTAALDMLRDNREALIEEARRGLSDAISEIRTSYAEELSYLDVGLGHWEDDAAERQGLATDALELAYELMDALHAYSETRPQAPTRRLELARAIERAESEETVYRLVAAWDVLMSSPVEDDAANPTDPQAPNEANESSAALPEEYAALRMQVGNWKQKYEQAQAALNNRTKERDQARKKVEALQIQMVRLERQRGVDGPPSADAGDTARLADTTGSEPQVRNVRDAIAVAKDRFPGTLTIAPNSASENDTPFQRPDEVYAALEWLATEYYELHTNPQGADPREFDRRLKEACPGWSYTSKQSDTAKNKFKVEYKTTADERTYTLDQHVGKGTKGDPQYMIRIAFAWGEDIKKVVVGYIGRHQRTQAS